MKVNLQILIFTISLRLLLAQDVSYNTEFHVNSNMQFHQFFPSVCNLLNGGFVVCWTSNAQDNSGDGIYAQVFNRNGVKKGSEFRVNTTTNGSQSWQSVERTQRTRRRSRPRAA